MEPRIEELFAVEVKRESGGWSLLRTNGRECLFTCVVQANDVASREGLMRPTRVVRFNRESAVSKFPRMTDAG